MLVCLIVRLFGRFVVALLCMRACVFVFCLFVYVFVCVCSLD